MRRLFLTVVLLAVLAAGAVAWWMHQPLPLAAQTVEVDIEPGTLPRGVAQAVVNAGVRANPDLLYWYFRLSGQARQIKAGSYEIETGVTPRRLLAKLARGEESLRALTLVEGWNIRQVRAALAKEDALRHDTAAMDDAALMAQLGRPGVHPEGRFFPDTYTYSKNSSDIALLRRAMRAMDRRLQAAWEQRTPKASVRTPEDALILASIVEKETGKGADRPLVSAVFNNRLRQNIPLQTDPTVIYGLGEKFDGNLRKVDLQTDTPYNTYLRTGLPPTPIALPGKASLLAAVRPDATKALYFVSRGDGTSEFSDNLAAHNRAVDRYQRGRQ